MKWILVFVLPGLLAACVTSRRSAELVRVEDLDHPIKEVAGPKINLIDIWDQPHGPHTVQEAVVSFIVQEDGSIADFNVVSATGRKIKSAAIATKSSWRFEPATSHGLPARFRLTVPIVADLLHTWSVREDEYQSRR